MHPLRYFIGYNIVLPLGPLRYATSRWKLKMIICEIMLNNIVIIIVAIITDSVSY